MIVSVFSMFSPEEELRMKNLPSCEHYYTWCNQDGMDFCPVCGKKLELKSMNGKLAELDSAWFTTKWGYSLGTFLYEVFLNEQHSIDLNEYKSVYWDKLLDHLDFCAEALIEYLGFRATVQVLVMRTNKPFELLSCVYDPGTDGEIYFNRKTYLIMPDVKQVPEFLLKQELG